ncbi:hypothetical protein D5R81_16410 [Parashewanella spongiae]|uniref:Large polyvalent protein-associated domain-containing protein n=1 Tax=Parashewanella spongiae TaxID=342950 RepID=A0A3A6TQR0_9GAMM|nr:CLCA_X family protein [Parashewanella spongiae]MCL1079703.1 hypothetical protein [Parashewanella spongiae]RJY07171.1 hypothetical protein D5R81_16410 [Parashewanella spongiae]
MLSRTKYHRSGPDYRFGEQVDFLDIKTTFGFYHVRVGRWVTKEESKLAANLVFDSLADLAFILNLPPKAIGLRETLSLAFGHGGRKGVQAHYDVNHRQLALAKNAGAGALAHEFWHAFDHYIADKVFVYSDTKNLFASELWLKDQPMFEHPLNERLNQLFGVAFLEQGGVESSDYVRNGIKLDKDLGTKYYSLPTELMARAFESSIEFYQGIQNSYLVSGTINSSTKISNIFPDTQHKELIFKAIIDYFNPLGMALSTEK